MKVLIVHNVIEELIKGQSADLVAEQEVQEIVTVVMGSLRSRGYDATTIPVVSDLAIALAPFDPTEYVIFNLVESLDNGRVPETQATTFFESKGFVFTGSGTRTLELAMHKQRTKEILAGHGLLTPCGQIFRTPDEDFKLTFPAIVKPVAEDASLGISADSVVFSLKELRQRVAYVLRAYHQAALVEEFTDGREINVAVWGNDPPEVLPLSELDFSGIKDLRFRIGSYETKWIEGSYGFEVVGVVCPAIVEPDVDTRIKQIAIKTYQVLGCHNYARIDLRLRRNEIYVLEVNPNPSLSPGGLMRSARVAGYDFAATVARIVEFALARRAS